MKVEDQPEPGQQEGWQSWPAVGSADGPPGSRNQWTFADHPEAAPEPRPRVGRAVGFAILAILVLAGIGLLLDLDRDGASTLDEFDQGTSLLAGDSDADGLADGWERTHGLAPDRSDSDGDTLDDGAEIAAGADPRSQDSDGDGWGDALEWPGADCDQDGTPSVIETDDDDDGRWDSLEPAEAGCTADADRDGVLDGAEGNDLCMLLTDCDADGLGDASETGTFDPLDPDSFGSGVSDAISLAFQDSGQATGADDDQDGIPDPWETSDGLIAWGELQPVPGQRDFLVEFVRVVGPDSGRYDYLDFEDSYEEVAETFLTERGIQMDWTETFVELDDEQDPPIIPTSDDPYYSEVLRAADYSENPYVTTVVLNPQHDQSQILHAGVAPIRGMLAAVDYGAHVVVDFETDDGQSVTITPLVESVVRAEDRGYQTDLLIANGFDGADLDDDGWMRLHVADSNGNSGYTLGWQSSWFQTAPIVSFDDGGPDLQLTEVGAEVDEVALAHTILHEIGHTLGLCHTHLPDCVAAYSAADQVNQARSTMSYESGAGTMHFLTSEWQVVDTYLTCPPQDPLGEVAAGGSGADIREAKYAYSTQSLEELELRQCELLEPVPREYGSDEPAQSQYLLPASLSRPVSGGGPEWVIAYAAASLLAAGGLFVVLLRRP